MLFNKIINNKKIISLKYLINLIYFPFQVGKHLHAHCCDSDPVPGLQCHCPKHLVKSGRNGGVDQVRNLWNACTTGHDHLAGGHLPREGGPEELQESQEAARTSGPEHDDCRVNGAVNAKPSIAMTLGRKEHSSNSAT